MLSCCGPCVIITLSTPIAFVIASWYIRSQSLGSNSPRHVWFLVDGERTRLEQEHVKGARQNGEIANRING